MTDCSISKRVQDSDAWLAKHKEHGEIENMICERCKTDKPDWVHLSKPAGWVPDYPPTDPMPLSEVVCFDCLTNKEHLAVSLSLRKTGEATRLDRLAQAAASRMARINGLKNGPIEIGRTDGHGNVELNDVGKEMLHDDFGPVRYGAIPLYDFQCLRCKGFVRTTDNKHGGICANCLGKLYADFTAYVRHVALDEPLPPGLRYIKARVIDEMGFDSNETPFPTEWPSPEEMNTRKIEFPAKPLDADGWGIFGAPKKTETRDPALYGSGSVNEKPEKRYWPCDSPDCELCAPMRESRHGAGKYYIRCVKCSSIVPTSTVVAGILCQECADPETEPRINPDYEEAYRGLEAHAKHVALDEPLPPRFQPGDVYASLPTGAHSAGLSDLSSFSVKLTRLKTPKQSWRRWAWRRVVLFIYETTDRISEWAFQRLQPDEPIPMVCTEVDHETKTVTFDSQLKPKGEDSC